MSKNPFFSIITPTYNRASQLASVIEAVQAQLFNNYEHIIIDDGSADHTRSLVTDYCNSDKRIHYIHQLNQGRSKARNLGIEHSTGIYVCFLDSDDTWNEEYLLELQIAIEKGEGSFFATRMVWVSGKSHSKTPRPIKSFSSGQLHRVIEQEVGMNVCVKRNLFVQNLFNQSLSMNEDYELWMRIICQNSLHVTAVPSSEYYATTEEPFGRLDSRSIDGMFKALRTMKNQPCILKSVSNSFWKNRTRNLKLNRVKALERENRFWAFSASALKYVINYPTDLVNPSLLVSVVYGLPGGKLIKRVVEFAKRTNR